MQILLPPVIVVAFALSRLGIAAGDGFAIAIAMQFISVLGSELVVPISREIVYGIGALAAVAHGTKRGKGQILLSILGYVLGLAMGSLSGLEVILNQLTVFLDVWQTTGNQLAWGLASLVAMHIASTIIGGAIAIIVLYTSLVAESFISASLTALNRAVFRFLYVLLGTSWAIVAGLLFTTVITTLNAVAWGFVVMLIFASLKAIVEAILANIAKGTIWIGLGNALSALGSSLLIATILGDMRRIVARALRSLGGRPSVSKLALLLAVALLASITFEPLLAYALTAYYIAIVLSIAYAVSEPHPPRRARAVNAVADTIYALALARHVAYIFLEPWRRLVEWLGGGG